MKRHFQKLSNRTTRILAMISIASAPLFSSCTLDDEVDQDSSGSIPVLSTPPYQEESAKYVATESGSGVSSIELTADGYFIVIPENIYSSYYSYSTASTRKMPVLTPTRAYQGGIIYGQFVKISDTEYILPGFGTITIEGSINNVVSLYVNTEDGETLTISTKKASEAPDSKITAAVCRAWNTVNSRIKASVNGQLIFDQTAPESQLYSVLIPALTNALNSWAISHGYDGEMEPSDIADESYGYATSVMFSRSGTYFVSYSTGLQALSTWSWVNEGKGILRYSWDYNNQEGYSAGMSGNTVVTFENETMILESLNEIVDDDITLSISIFDYCTPLTK